MSQIKQQAVKPHWLIKAWLAGQPGVREQGDGSVVIQFETRHEQLESIANAIDAFADKAHDAILGEAPSDYDSSEWDADQRRIKGYAEQLRIIAGELEGEQYYGRL